MTLTLKPNQRVSVKNDAGGTLTSLTTVSLKPGQSVTVTAAQPVVPTGIRAAWTYFWYPQTFVLNGKHVAYHPSIGVDYDSADPKVIDSQIKALDYAKVQVAIMSWWGVGKQRENTILPLWLDRIAVLGSPLKVAFYYEKEGFGNPSQSEISADLAYLKQTYGGALATRSPLTVFVYNADDVSCAVADKWKAANTLGAYINLKVISGFAACPSQPGGWHQYGPAQREHPEGNCFAISPGFWRADETAPRLARDLNQWKQNVRDMVASGKEWGLVTTFNEWGEGTAVESATEWATGSGFGAYLDALHTDGA